MVDRHNRRKANDFVSLEGTVSLDTVGPRYAVVSEYLPVG